MKTIVLFAFMLIAVSAQTPSKSIAPATDERRPEITVDQALDIARTHVGKHRIDVSKKYIDSVQFNLNPRGKKGEHWKITWESAEFTKGGQIFLFVYMDKSVEIGYGE
jgi:hypothetical protein